MHLGPPPICVSPSKLKTTVKEEQREGQTSGPHRAVQIQTTSFIYPSRLVRDCKRKCNVRISYRASVVLCIMARLLLLSFRASCAEWTDMIRHPLSSPRPLTGPCAPIIHGAQDAIFSNRNWSRPAQRRRLGDDGVQNVRYPPSSMGFSRWPAAVLTLLEQPTR